MISREELFGGTAVTPMLLERQPVAREPTFADTYDENKLINVSTYKFDAFFKAPLASPLQ